MYGISQSSQSKAGSASSSHCKKKDASVLDSIGMPNLFRSSSGSSGCGRSRSSSVGSDIHVCAPPAGERERVHSSEISPMWTRKKMVEVKVEGDNAVIEELKREGESNIDMSAVTVTVPNSQYS
jgi:hypothetical protein